MSEAWKYFFTERYRGLPNIGRLPHLLETETRRAIEELCARADHPDSVPDQFSQELLFIAEPEIRDRYLDRETLFPFYAHSGDERFWRCLRGQAPYLERLQEQLEHLDIELIEQLWLERGRGMAKALPSPSDPRAHWRSVEHLAPHPLRFQPPEGGYAAVFVVPRLGIGGSEKVMRELIAALERLTGAPSLIIVADTTLEPSALPPGAICLPNLSFHGEPFLESPIPSRVMALRDIILRIGAPRVITINSFLGNALLQDGALQREGLKTAAAIFFVATGPGGAIRGYIEIVDWLIDAGVTIFTDNDHIARLIAGGSFYDETVVLPAPETVRPGPIADGPSVLWAGRIDRQKRPDLMLEVARLSPHRRFEVWGTPILSADSVMDAIKLQPNIDYRGGFDGFAQIDRRNVGCMLYTSAFDGTPNILLEAMAFGVPCLCTGVGGIPDLMARGRGLVLAPDASAQAYADALESLMADPARRVDMVRRARAHIRLAHSREAFDAAVGRLLEKLQPSSGPAPLHDTG
jgi:glycosyltransferase involved in cell wall biosynthesis